MGDMTVSTKGGGKINPLTSIRFFAAFYVVLYHTSSVAMPWNELGGFAARFINLGGVSVSFFFLLSGYILAWVYLRQDKPIDRRRFYAARVARIYPIYFITLLADTPFLLASRIARYGLMGGVVKTGISFTGCLFMLQAWIGRFGGIDFPNWSLSDETFFYLLFPLISVPLWRLRGWWTVFAMILVFVFGQVLALAVTPHVSPIMGSIFPALQLSTFILGILLARLQFWTAEQGVFGVTPKWTANCLIAMAIAAFAIFIQLTSGAEVGSWSNILVAHGILAPIFCALIWALSGTETLVSRVLSIPWIVVLGESSYALYLIHIPLENLFASLQLWRAATYPLYLALCILLSVASSFWLEAPARKWILSKLQTQSSGSASKVPLAI